MFKKWCVVGAVAASVLAFGASPVAAGPAIHKPDGQIKINLGFYQGVNWYLFMGDGYGPLQEDDQENAQTQGIRFFDYRVENDGTVADRFRISGAKSDVTFKITYFKGTKVLTKDVVKGRYKTPKLAPGEKHHFEVEVRAKGTPPSPATFRYPIVATSTTNGGAVDVVRFVIDNP